MQTRVVTIADNGLVSDAQTFCPVGWIGRVRSLHGPDPVSGPKSVQSGYCGVPSGHTEGSRLQSTHKVGEEAWLCPDQALLGECGGLALIHSGA